MFGAVGQPNPEPKPNSLQPNSPPELGDNQQWFEHGFEQLCAWLKQHAAFDDWLVRHGRA